LRIVGIGAGVDDKASRKASPLRKDAAVIPTERN
jgi:hypothetical protein